MSISWWRRLPALLLGVWIFGTLLLFRTRPAVDTPRTDDVVEGGHIIEPSYELLEKRLTALQGEIHQTSRQLFEMGDQIRDLVSAIHNAENPEIAKKLKVIEDAFNHSHERTVLPVLVLACNRVTVTDHLEKLLSLRADSNRHPVIVSQDCDHHGTRAALERFKGRVQLIFQPNQTEFKLPVKQKKFQGYYKLARHYKWALDKIFIEAQYPAVIITEDDLDLSPDFFSYFQAMYLLLATDPTLFCVSAWNDNGKQNLILDKPDLIHRSDFFPGLGWMLQRSLWLELRDKWPAAFWDDWLRQPEQRKGRSCLRPEIPRTGMMPAGQKGASSGQYYIKHLRFIQLNKTPVNFTRMNLSYLSVPGYNLQFQKSVYVDSHEVNVDALIRGDVKVLGSLRIIYRTKKDFVYITKKLGVMEDLKAGVPRCGYSGVVSVAHQGRRLYIAPPDGWKGYPTDW